MDITQNLKNSKNYRDICQSTINKLVESETPKFKKTKDIEQAVKTKLHTWAGMFFDDFKKSQKLLENGEKTDRDFYLQVLSRHISTRERFDFLQEFYDDISTVCKDCSRFLDIGCGFNPLSFFLFSSLSAEKYDAQDIVGKCIDFLNLCFKDLKVPAKAEVNDITQNIPTDKFDVVFLLKILPLLVQQSPKFNEQLLKTLDTKYFVVTYPTKTLGGKNVGMYNKYQEDIKQLCEVCNLKTIFEKEYKNEILFILEK